jgi:hypothetical protein
MEVRVRWALLRKRGWIGLGIDVQKVRKETCRWCADFATRGGCRECIRRLYEFSEIARKQPFVVVV